MIYKLCVPLAKLFSNSARCLEQVGAGEARGRRSNSNTNTNTNNTSGSDSSQDDLAHRELVQLAFFLVKIGVSIAATFYLLKMASDPFFSQAPSKDSKARLLKKIRNRDLTKVEFTSYELNLCDDIVDPEDIHETFDQIGGLENEVEDIQDNVILPFKAFGKFDTSLASYPSGVLLYGPPGTGKTMLAKAIAKETSAVFINLRMANIFHKWFGESDKAIAALFSLARKLSPSIIFIDEIDCFLGSRGGSSTDPAVIGNIQAHFLTEWDGLSTNRAAPVLILAATNRPEVIDRAILRRMPCTLRTSMPSQVARYDILCKMLMSEEVDADVQLDELAQQTQGYSGSDLRELCRVASTQRIKERMKHQTNDDSDNVQLRPLSRADFEISQTKVKPSAEVAEVYGNEKRMDAVKSFIQSLIPATEPKNDPAEVDETKTHA